MSSHDTTHGHAVPSLPIGVVRLSGGLGNQLFQYGFARGLAARSSATVLLDASYLKTTQDHVTRRDLRLNRFQVALPFAEPKDLKQAGFPDFTAEDFTNKIARKWFTFRESFRDAKAKQFVIDTSEQFLPNVQKIAHTTYFAGNWLSPKYFDDLRPALLNELTLREPLSPVAHKMDVAITESVSVALHVRRGDYAKYPKFALCPPEYYERALAYIREKVGRISVFVFSDDPEYVRKHISDGDQVTFVSGNDLPDYEELVLMSHCRHIVMANSSFSWWGAWLNTHPDKIVVAPQAWKTDGSDLSDYLPESLGWLRM